MSKQQLYKKGDLHRKTNGMVCCFLGHPILPASLHQMLHPTEIRCPRIWSFLGSVLDCRLIPNAVTSTANSYWLVKSQTKYPHFWAVFFSAGRVAPWASHTTLYPPIGLLLCFSKPCHACILLHAYLPFVPDPPNAWAVIVTISTTALTAAIIVTVNYNWHSLRAPWAAWASQIITSLNLNSKLCPRYH